MKILTALIINIGLLSAGIIATQPTVEHPWGTYIDGDTLYVSNLGESLDTKNGYISKYNLNGSLIKKEFVSKLAAPRGMAKSKEILFVADKNRVLGFDEKGKEVFNMRLPRADLLSDIVLRPNGNLLVSDSENGNIFEINIDTKKYRSFAKMDIQSYGKPSSMIIYDGKVILAASNYNKEQKGSIGFFNLEGDKSYQLMGKEREDFKGIVLNNAGYLIVSVWQENGQGQVYELNFKAKLLKTYPLSDLLKPSDISYKKGFLYIPLQGSSKLLMIKESR